MMDMNRLVVFAEKQNTSRNTIVPSSGGSARAVQHLTAPPTFSLISVDCAVYPFSLQLVHLPRGRYLPFRYHLDTMTLPCPPRDCTICLESLALHGRPIVLAVPCGHCLHERCFNAWSAARTAQRTAQNRLIPCPCCNQIVQGTNICFSFESNPDENVENGDSDTGPTATATRQAFSGELSWKHVGVGLISFPLKLVVDLVTVPNRADYNKIILLFIIYFFAVCAVVFTLDHGVHFYTRHCVLLLRGTRVGTAAKKKSLAVNTVVIAYGYLKLHHGIKPLLRWANAVCSDIDMAVDVCSEFLQESGICFDILFYFQQREEHKQKAA
jgi:hypothetical protein